MKTKVVQLVPRINISIFKLFNLFRSPRGAWREWCSPRWCRPLVVPVLHRVLQPRVRDAVVPRHDAAGQRREPLFREQGNPAHPHHQDSARGRLCQLFMCRGQQVRAGKGVYTAQR